MADVTPQVLEKARAGEAPEVPASLPAVAVVGLGYVGLPVAVAFGRERRTIGFDLSRRRVDALRNALDVTGELSAAELLDARYFTPTDDPAGLGLADFVIVAVPTPVDRVRRPDLGALVSASEIVGRHMKPGATVVYESTVYPGATEEVCVPILERASGMRWGLDFHVGYSPERINPGDREHRFAEITKVVSGDDAQTLEALAELYGSVVKAGVYRAPSIRVAEAAKVIENAQRDINIAFVNELAILFDRMGIDTQEVLSAAATKWNFLPFRPGLVGGHCIGVDPYYLTHKAELLGYHPEVILAGRRINDGMGAFIARKTVQQMIAAGRSIKGARVNVLGLTFKENCTDIRNSRVVDILRELAEYGVTAHVHDPLASRDEALLEYGVRLQEWEALPAADALVLAVGHRAFLERTSAELTAKVMRRGCVIDVKSVLDAEALRARGLSVWRL